VIQEGNVADLSQRDRALFVAILNDADAKPTGTLTRAAKRYRRQVR
jgi:uncharacterized protein (DUF1778 family)